MSGTTRDARGRAGSDGRRAVVVGGGIAGLATAALLGAEGYEVTLLEARDQVGGRAGLWRSDGFAFDTGPSWYLMPEVFDHFFRLLGTSADAELDLVRLDPGYRVFFESEPPLDVRSDLEGSVALFEEVEPGAGERLREYLRVAADTYDMATRYFLYTTFASLLPLMRPDVVARLPRLARLLTRSLEDHVGERFADRRLRQVLGYPAVFLGSAPRITPSMYHLMSHLDLADGVLYPQGGFAELIERIRALAEKNGVDVRTRADVVRIETEPLDDDAAGASSSGSADRLRPLRRAGRAALRRPVARATGVRVREADGTVTTLPADVVVSAVDLHQAETRLLPAHLRDHSPRWWRRRLPGPSAVLVYLGVRGRLPELEHHSLFFTEDWQHGFDAIFPRGTRHTPSGGPDVPFPSPASLYVCRPSATDPGVAPEGDENLFVLVPVPADPRLGRGAVDRAGDPWVEAVADAAIGQVARWAGVPDLAERVVVRRTVGPADFAEDLRTWHGTALGPAHTLAQSAMFRAGNASRKVAGLLHAGGTTIPGIGLPMCLISAELVLKRLRGDTSAGPLPEPQAGTGAGTDPGTGTGAGTGPGAAPGARRA
ncbi:phytoene desaturase family protein [Cellulomonas carbonis]|uniref:Phytoene dehydrogenase n=1 Tax=Cellulomonas carbonis T26 TaxID=947969 RepID=A0A0A0BNX4_9CELL|nr:phytoene desaturase family protein [Cellulomonas carbonis]KGM09650.1 phytoene dehydrogenase [Cellulomonas carbonis T26]GGC07029.1 phytoene desaturase [Cellulomonas carbonis]